MSRKEPNFYEEALSQIEKFRLEDAMKEAGCNNLKEYEEYLARQNRQPKSKVEGAASVQAGGDTTKHHAK